MMSNLFRISAVVASITMAAVAAQAQTVSMYGSYGEGNGIIVNIPQNPPLVACNPADAKCVGKRDLLPAQLITITTPSLATSMVAPALSGTPNAVPFIRNGPSFGVIGAQIINDPGSALQVGGAFTVPALAMAQRRGHQVGQVAGGSAVKQLDTTFTAAAPGVYRDKNAGIDSAFYTVTPVGFRGVKLSDNPAYVAPAQTRMMAARTFSATNVDAHGQNNGLATTDVNYEYRQALNTTHTVAFGNDVATIQYSNTNAAGFTGTMGIMLDGTGRLYFHNPFLSAAFSPPSAPNGLAPIVGTNPVGDNIPGFRLRNAAGWNYTVRGRQVPGRFKAFGPAVPFIPIPTSMGGTITGVLQSRPGIQGTPCPISLSIAPNATCNLLTANFNAYGATVAPASTATSVKHLFAWTTGTVSAIVSGPRQGINHVLTQTGMGYDTVTVGGARQVGLVAGSYTRRTAPATGVQEINPQMAGMDLVFTPEPGATVALLSGIGLLGALAVRRR